MQHRFLYSFILFLFSLPAFSQTFTVEGMIADSATKESLIGVNILITDVRDTSKVHFATTDINGYFKSKPMPAGIYRLEALYIGYAKFEKRIRVVDANVNTGTIPMSESVLGVTAVEITARIPAVQQKGDTTELNADAFKTHENATAEDLVTKMPGITVENGQVKAQGEEIKKVLVDGKEFFGDDPNVALKNLPADMIDKVQVYDRASDQSAFTGIDDGNAAKTINIITKRDRRNGYFGKVYGGYGTDERYNAGGNFNLMRNTTRISVLGLSNNINQQNFSMQDILGATGSSGGGFGGGGPRGGGGSGGPRGGGMGGFGGGSASNFMVGQQSGISTTNSIGFNIATTIGKKINLTGSYFYNQSNNISEQSLTRNFFVNADTSQLYRQNSLGESNNFNHRANLRFEYAIDSMNALIITPSIRFQKSNSINTLTGQSTLREEQLLNSLENRNTTSYDGYNLSNEILYKHSFNKKGRTFSASLNTGLNDRIGETSLYSVNNFYSGTMQTGGDTVNQRADVSSNGYNLSTRLNYTEPIGEKSVLQFSYRNNKTYSKSERNTFNADAASGQFNVSDTLLSNSYENSYFSQSGGLDYQHNAKKGTLSVGLEYQKATLDGNQFFPSDNDINRTFYNILPNAMYVYKFTDKANLRIRYRTSTNAPNVTQLQNVVNNTNPLQLSSGNANLVQDFSQMLFARFQTSNTEKARNTFIMLMVNNTQNYIGNSTVIARNDTSVNGVFLNRGSQLTYPVNLDGYWNARTFFTYSKPVKFIKSNLNTNTGITYTRTPGLINNQQNIANTVNFSQGVTVSSNISKELDFTVSYSANYNIVNNTIRPELNNNYFFHNTSAKLNWIFWQGLFVQTDATHTLYQGLTSTFNQSFLLWNAAIGKKLFKNQVGEIKLSVFDILKQNNSISRTVTETYIEDAQTKVLQRYFMLTFTYTLRNFKKGAEPPAEQPMNPMFPQHPHHIPR